MSFPRITEKQIPVGRSGLSQRLTASTPASLLSAGPLRTPPPVPCRLPQGNPVVLGSHCPWPCWRLAHRSAAPSAAPLVISAVNPSSSPATLLPETRWRWLPPTPEIQAPSARGARKCPQPPGHTPPSAKRDLDPPPSVAVP